jgi:hypothetical protein
MFDPYHKWLGIPKGKRPPTHYQLLGIAADEADAEVIKEAALRQTAHVRVFQTGPHSEVCTCLLNEIAQARAVLLNAELREAYDARLQSAAESVAETEPEGRQILGYPANLALAAAGYVLVLLAGFSASLCVSFQALRHPTDATRSAEPAPGPAEGDRQP